MNVIGKSIRKTVSSKAWAVPAIASLALALAACGTSGHTAASTSATSQLASRPSGPSSLKIAYLTGGSITTFLTTQNNATLTAAKAAGASIEMFDPAFNPTTQYDEMANVISGGKFNSIILTPISAQVMCPLVKQAIAKGIEVVTVIDPVCGLTYANGAASWYPGTLQAVAAQTPLWWNEFFQHIVQANPGGGQVAVFTGQSILPLTVDTNNAAKTEFAGTKLSLVSSVAGDYTAATAFTDASDVFKSHPGIRVIVSNYSGMTAGIISAARAAGILNSVRIYDVGGTSQSLQLVSSGVLAMTSPLYPAKFGTLSVNALIEHSEGKTVPHYVDPLVPLQYVTKANWQQFESDAY